MDGPRASTSLYRLRNVRRVMHYAQPMLTKHVIGFETDRTECNTNRTPNSAAPRKDTNETALDRIVANLGQDCDAENIILMITPSKRHAHHMKLHALDCLRFKHLGMTTVTTRELAKLKSSQSFNKYNFLFGSRYMGLKAMTQNTNLIRKLVSSVAPKCDVCLPEMKSSASQIEENSMTSQDFVRIRCSICALKTANSSTQTEEEVIEELITISITLLKAIVKTLNSSKVPSKPDLERFFMCASKMSLLLLIRPAFVGKSYKNIFLTEEVTQFYVDTYLPGECYIGCITVSGHDLIQELDKYPKLLESIAVMDDVMENVPLTGWLIKTARKILFALGLEFVYDVMIEFILSWNKKLSFLRK